MSVLVFGRTGQVARELAALNDTICLDRTQADLGDPAACAAAIYAAQPWGVINAAAYTAVDKAEDEELQVGVINAEAPRSMAVACADLGIPFVSISTDYVFDGSGDTPRHPSDSTGPLGAYGRSKLAGEMAVAAAGGTWAVLRTSWVVSAHGNNFVKTMLRLGKEHPALNIVADQVGGPTPARAIAQACMTMLKTLASEPEKRGIYHFSGAPDVSWADFARAIFMQAGFVCAVTDIPTSAYPTPAPRPRNSRLECSQLKTAFGISRPDWSGELDGILKELGVN